MDGTLIKYKLSHGNDLNNEKIIDGEKKLLRSTVFCSLVDAPFSRGGFSVGPIGGLQTGPLTIFRTAQGGASRHVPAGRALKKILETFSAATKKKTSHPRT